MNPSIYSPEVRAHALLHGISDLQAYRKLRDRQLILDREQAARRLIINDFLAEKSQAARVEQALSNRTGPANVLFNWLCSKIAPDWNMHG